MTSSNSLTPIPGASSNSIPPSHQQIQQRGAPNYFECFPDEKLIPSVTLDYLRGSRAAYNICVKLTRVLKVPWMILVTSMAYWHRFFFAHHQMQYKRNNNNHTNTSSTLDNNKDGRRSRSQTPSLAGKHNNLSSSLKTSASEQNLAGLVFENDAIDTEDEDEILAQEKTFEKYHPVLVAVSAFFLALKTECIHRGLKAIVTHAFEISSSNEQYPIRREQIIRIELMLMHTLNFHVFQELPWTRALELLPQQQQQVATNENVNHNDAAGSNQNNNNNNNSSKAMLSLFQKVLGYLVQFPFQACYSASAIAECAVWFVADSLEVPQKDEIEAKFNATTENIRQRFANHIIDHIAYNNRPEGREIPKLAAKITALKTRMRMQYGTTGGGSSTGNGNSSSVIGGGGQNPQSGYSSHHYHPTNNTNNQNIINHNRNSSSSMLVGNQSLQISPVPATTTTTTSTTNNLGDNMNNNVGVNYSNSSNASNVGGMSSRIRPRDEQQALPSNSNSAHMNYNNNNRMPQLSVRRPPPQK